MFFSSGAGFSPIFVINFIIMSFVCHGKKMISFKKNGMDATDLDRFK